MLEPTPNTPIVNDGLLYVNGLEISNTASSVKTLFLNPGAARDSKNVNDITLSSRIIINGLRTGANGVDVAPLAANLIYAVYVVADSNLKQPTAGLLSLSSTPFLPYGYDMFRRVGWIVTDGSANIVNFVQIGAQESREYYYQDQIQVLSSGTSTTYAFISLSSVVPLLTNGNVTVTNEVFLNLVYNQSVATNFAEFHYNIFSPAPVGIVTYSCGNIAIVPASVRVPSQLQKIAYKVSAGDALRVSVTGYTDYLY